MSAQIETVIGMGAEPCPHPAAREFAAIALRSRRRWMVVCRTCFDTFGGLIEGYHSGRTSLRQVYARMRMLQYSRADSARFAAQLLADRVRIRLGLLDPEVTNV